MNWTVRSVLVQLARQGPPHSGHPGMGGPAAVLLALLAAERGLSVRLLAGPGPGQYVDEPPALPGSGLLGVDLGVAGVPVVRTPSLR